MLAKTLNKVNLDIAVRRLKRNEIQTIGIAISSTKELLKVYSYLIQNVPKEYRNNKHFYLFLETIPYNSNSISKDLKLDTVLFSNDWSNILYRSDILNATKEKN